MTPLMADMTYRSTRGASTGLTFEEAVLTGLATDGGLLVPNQFPHLPSGWEGWGYTEAMMGVLGMFGARNHRDLVADAAAQFPADPAPVVQVGETKVYELFWGPTLSFKDHALQIVGRLLDQALGALGRRGIVLGATSGDTGSAAIEACRGRDNLDVVILFPEDRVTEFQRRQMTTVLDRNVHVLAVRGTFDDCQRLVKSAFTASESDLVAINSINWARIACQVGYYVALAGRLAQPFDLAIPTGNFGNAYSAWVARRIGVPIGTITIANNSNHGLADRVVGATSHDLDVVPTVAPSMDIAVPSNLERFAGDLSREFRGGWVSDDEIVETIASVHTEYGYLLDPHSASAWAVGKENRSDRPQVVAATAHPAKFAETIRLATGVVPSVPEGWTIDPDLTERKATVDADIESLLRFLEKVDGRGTR